MLSIVSTLPRSDQEALAILCCSSVLCLKFVDGDRHGRAWALWTAALLAVTLPLADFTPHPNWQHVGLVPFYSAPVKLTDIAANLILYVPFGWVAMSNNYRGRPVSIAAAVAAAFAVSFTAEAAQLFSIFRYPSATDLVCNAIGAGVGASVASVVGRIGQRRPVFAAAATCTVQA